MIIGIDIETYSSNDLQGCGVYKYVEAPDFQVLLFAYNVNGGAVRCVDLAMGEELPEDIKKALTDESVIKTAFNATFERVCLSKWLGLDKPMSAKSWRCTMVAAARMGLPLSLGKCGEVLELEQGKMKEGKELIKLFSVPNKHGEQNRPETFPSKWETFKKYNVRDVETEQQILARVREIEQPLWEQELYTIDQEINDRGVKIDRQLVENADRFNDEYVEQLKQQAAELTGLSNANSPAQLKAWFSEQTGTTVTSLNKKAFDGLAEDLKKSPKGQKVLALRREMGKTSCAKYGAMLACVSDDGRIHGLTQYYGAARTGRWAGRFVQLQNLPQNHLKSLDNARQLVKAGDLEEFSMEYGNVTQVLSELIRTSFVADDGKIFHVCDFSAIEARVIAWLAGEEWVLDVFRNDGDIYCATASQMFHCPVEKHGINSDLRPKGKIAVLALGYGGGKAALAAFGAEKMGMSDADMADTVRKWRNSNPHIVRLWQVVEDAARKALTEGGAVEINRGVTFRKEGDCLTVELPSHRRLCYPWAEYSEIENRYGECKEAVHYKGMNQTTKLWQTLETYGGKMVENIVQAIARDVLAVIMFRAKKRGLDIVFHVHDEIIVEAKEGQTLDEVQAMFSEPIKWADGLPLKGAGYSTPYYLKD